jgi:tripartite ATP-independent transporter DctP family solute receptor
MLIGLLAAVATGCSDGSDVVAIKLGHALDVSHPVHKAMVYMGERLVEKSDSTMRIDIYPSQQLGTERETLELLQIGSLGLTKVSSSVMEGFVPEFQVFGLPYLFRDEAHRFYVWDGGIGDEILNSAERFGFRGLTYYDAGTRSFYTKDRHVRTPEDLSGLKIRVQESPVATQMVSVLGGSPTPIAWGELYTALQQGIVDGAENNPPSFYTSRHYEVCKYYSLDQHTAVPDVVLVSSVLWNDLTPQQRTWLREAADESAVYQRQLWAESVKESLAAVREAGVDVIEPDISPFADKVAPLYESYRSNEVVYDLIRRIQAAASELPADTGNQAGSASSEAG